MKLIDKIDREAVELDERIKKLETFCDSKECQAMSHEHRYLLAGQLEAMEQYDRFLVARLRLLEREEREKRKRGV